MDFAHELVGGRDDDTERAVHDARSGMLPGLPNAGNAKRLVGLEADGMGLLRLAPPDGFPFEEVVDRNDTAALGVGAAEHRRAGDTLRGRVDGLSFGELSLIQ